MPIHDPVVRVNVHKHKKYLMYYNQKILDKVNEYMKEDFIRFNYPMVNTMEELHQIYTNEENH